MRPQQGICRGDILNGVNLNIEKNVFMIAKVSAGAIIHGKFKEITWR